MSNLCFAGGQLICSGVVTADAVAPGSSLLLLTGTVYSPSGIPLPGAAVEILSYHPDNPDEVVRLGLSFTLSDGTYALSLPRIPGRQYELRAFSSI